MVRFDISDLQIFVNVVQSGSITRGAERSNRAPASISARIKEMEADMGTPLLVRTYTGGLPTEAGRALLSHGYKLLADVQNMNDELAEFGKRAKGIVRLCCNSVSVQELLVEPVGRFLAAHPGVDLAIQEMVNDQITQAVSQGQADFGIMAEPVDRGELQTFAFATDRYVIVTPSTWPNLLARSARFADFLDHEFIGPGRGTWMHLLLQQHAAANGKPMRNHVQVRSFPMTCALVAKGIGVGIVPAVVALRLRQQLDFRIVELQDEWARLPLVICMRHLHTLPPNASKLVQLLIEHGRAQKLKGVAA